MSIEGRAQLPGARRVVVKVGSSSISGENAGKIADSGAELHPVTTATTVRRADGAPVVTDGPFSEAKARVCSTSASTTCRRSSSAARCASEIGPLPSK